MFVSRFAGRGVFTGKIVHGCIDREYGSPEDPVVLVLPNGKVDYYNTMVFTARRQGGRLAVILEVGGPTCHLVVNANEANVAVMMLPSAREKLPEGQLVTVDANRCQVVAEGFEEAERHNHRGPAPR